MTKIWSNHKKTLWILLLSIVFAGSFILANIFANILLPTNLITENITNPAFSVYLISLSKSQVKSESLSRAQDYQVLGAGGYIWEIDNYFHVISSGYSNKNDAQLVQNNIKLNYGIESELVTINFNDYTIYGEFSVDEKKLLAKALSLCITFYQSVCDIAISLDTAVFDETSAKLSANDTHMALASTYGNFDIYYPEPVPENLAPLKDLLNSALQIAQDLVTFDKEYDEQTYSSILKYRYLQMLELYYHFTNK